MLVSYVIKNVRELKLSNIFGVINNFHYLGAHKIKKKLSQNRNLTILHHRKIKTNKFIFWIKIWYSAAIQEDLKYVILQVSKFDYAQVKEICYTLFS